MAGINANTYSGTSHEFTVTLASVCDQDDYWKYDATNPAEAYPDLSFYFPIISDTTVLYDVSMEGMPLPQKIKMIETDLVTKESLCGPIVYTLVATETNTGDANGYFIGPDLINPPSDPPEYQFTTALDYLPIAAPPPYERKLDVSIVRKFTHSTKEDRLDFKIIELNCDMRK